MNFWAQAYRLLSVTARKTVPPVSVCGERLMFTQSNMDNSNFGVDEQGRTVLMNFSQIGVLPETFVVFTLKRKFGPIVDSLGLSGNSNMYSMSAIAHCLLMVADPSFGTSTCVKGYVSAANLFFLKKAWQRISAKIHKLRRHVWRSHDS